MPKWTEYTTKETLADNDEVMLYDATGKANKRGLMSKFWDYVVDKMATAVISKLETENKTVIGAINYLNGKSKIIQLSDKYEENTTFSEIFRKQAGRVNKGVYIFCFINLTDSVTSIKHGFCIMVWDYNFSTSARCVVFDDGSMDNFNVSF